MGILPSVRGSLSRPTAWLTPVSPRMTRIVAGPHRAVREGHRRQHAYWTQSASVHGRFCTFHIGRSLDLAIPATVAHTAPPRGSLLRALAGIGVCGVGTVMCVGRPAAAGGCAWRRAQPAMGPAVSTTAVAASAARNQLIRASCPQGRLGHRRSWGIGVLGAR